MPFCHDCGKEIVENTNFCPHCGKSQKEALKESLTPEKGVSILESCKKIDIRSRKSIIWILLIVIIITVIGFFFFFSGDGPKETITGLATGISTIKECPYQCCIASEYKYKPCNENYECINHMCVKSDCPYECCVGEQYKVRPCQGNYDCISNKCVKRDCPYECCEGVNYQKKSCSQGYDCVNNKCEPKDTDGDGLNDIEEQRYGTNPRLSDSDGDGLSDYIEIHVKRTNPTLSNTDGDRYDDAEDVEPTNKNTAVIQLSTVSNEGGWIFGLSQIASILNNIENINLKISDRTIRTAITNKGDDYSTYVRYTVYVYLEYGDEKPKLLSKKEVDIDKPIQAGQTLYDETYFEFRIIDYGEDLLQRILTGFGDKKYIIEYKNLQYERF